MIDAVMFALGAGVLTLLYAGFLAYRVVSAPSGNDKMKEIAKAILFYASL